MKAELATKRAALHSTLFPAEGLTVAQHAHNSLRVEAAAGWLIDRLLFDPDTEDGGNEATPGSNWAAAATPGGGGRRQLPTV